MVNIRNEIKEAFEVEADEVGFCLDQKWGDYENPYENSDTALAFNLFKKGWQAAKAQAVPEGFVLVERFKLLQMLGSAVAIKINPKTKTNLLESDFIVGELKAMIEDQEPAMTEITIRCTNCGLEFESDYDLEQNLVDQETGEIHDGCPTCQTDAYLMDLIKYPD